MLIAPVSGRSMQQAIAFDAVFLPTTPSGTRAGSLGKQFCTRNYLAMRFEGSTLKDRLVQSQTDRRKEKIL
jgi:hypothetical protein